MNMKARHTDFLLYEELVSSFDLQDMNLKTFSKEIYENIGQILSLVKMRLNTLQLQKDNDTEKIIEDSGQLLAKVIKDLRLLARQLSPSEIVKKGFAAALEYELQRMQDAGICQVEFNVTGKKFRLDPVREMMAFCLLQHLLKKALQEKSFSELECHIRYYKTKVTVSFSYKTGKLFYPLLGEEIVEEDIIKRANFINATVAHGRNEGIKTTKICFFK